MASFATLVSRTFPALTTLLCFVLLVFQQGHFRNAATQEREYVPARNRNKLMEVTNRTLGFEKIMVLSMPDRQDKRDLWSLASLYTDIDVEFVDGVKGSDMSAKSIPAGWNPIYDAATLGCYRGHMNMIQRVVKERISSALILEDDADYDVMLKSQLIEFARGTRYLQGVTDLDEPFSPYGDDWDVLWVGHGGIENRVKEDGKYYVIHDDPTVPPRSRWSNSVVTRHPDMSPPELQGNFTRMVFNSRHGVGGYGYAISLRGAEKLLLLNSVKPQANTIDLALRSVCTRHSNGIQCYAPFPSYMNNYKAPGNTAKDSDRVNRKTAFRKKGETWNIVFPTKLNLENFVDRNDVIKSQWPDDSMLREINRQELQLPKGKPIFLRQDEFNHPPK